VQACQICGRSFDPLGFQVVIPELGQGFDRVECARTARALAPAGSAIALAPLAPAVAPLGLAAAAAPVAAWRSASVPATTLGLLAAGTAAAVFLWLRVLGTDQAGFPLLRGDAPSTAAGETVEAQFQRQTYATAREAPASTRADTPTRIVVVSAAADGAVADGAVAPSPTSSEQPRHARRPSSGGEGGLARDGNATKRGGKDKSKGHHGKGKGLGHVKHGDANGSHTPGHGNPAAGSSQSTSNGQGHGNGHAKTKKH
jgi:hypothetical protein